MLAPDAADQAALASHVEEATEAGEIVRTAALEHVVEETRDREEELRLQRPSSQLTLSDAEAPVGLPAPEEPSDAEVEAEAEADVADDEELEAWRLRVQLMMLQEAAASCIPAKMSPRELVRTLGMAMADSPSFAQASPEDITHPSSRGSLLAEGLMTPPSPPAPSSARSRPSEASGVPLRCSALFDEKEFSPKKVHPVPPLDFSRVYMGDADTDLQAHDMLLFVRVSDLGDYEGADSTWMTHGRSLTPTASSPSRLSKSTSDGRLFLQPSVFDSCAPPDVQASPEETRSGSGIHNRFRGPSAPSASAPKEMGGARLGPGVFTLKVWAETFVSCHAATEASPQNWPPYNAGEVSQICGQDPCEASATSTNVAFCQATSPCPNYLQGWWSLWKQGKEAATPMAAEAIRRNVPNDHSCLFWAVAYLAEGDVGRAKAAQLREVCAQDALSDPDPLTRALLLGFNSVDEYAGWIRNEFHWGGENEIISLAKHYGLEVAVVCCESMQVLCYGSDLPACSARIYILYTGQHYDPIVSGSDADVPVEQEQKKHKKGDTSLEAKALELARRHVAEAAKKAKQRRAKKIKCGGCGALLSDAEAFATHCGEVDHDDDFAYDCEEVEVVIEEGEELPEGTVDLNADNVYSFSNTGKD
eukprot:s1214_g15.t1